MGPDGEKLLVLGHAARPLLIKRPVPASRVQADTAWRVAYDGIALRVRVRRRVAAYLRPVVPNEVDHLLPEDLLRCDQRRFAETRDTVLDEIGVGVRKRAVLRWGDVLLATLTSRPPDAPSLATATQEEIETLRRLRVSLIGQKELFFLLDVWDEQQHRRGLDCDRDGELPVVRVIPQREDTLLRRFRHAPAVVRAMIANLLVSRDSQAR